MIAPDRTVHECRDITHSFAPGQPDILSGVSFKVESGEFLSLVGASGSGKTTLLRILAGLIRPTSGSVLINANDVTGRPGRDRAMVFQDDRLYPWRTALDNAAFGVEAAHEKRSVARERATKALTLVGLPLHGGFYPHQLSGGMRQRVNVARALALDPDFLLMDEPFSALDAQTRELMQSELLKIWNTAQKGVVFVTHQIEEAVYLSDRVIVLGARPGRIRHEITVALPRPRLLSVKRDPLFHELCALIWSEIEDDVKTGMALEESI